MKNSITFTWMPWSWKTTIGKKLYNELSKFFDLEFIDFDDDILEKISLQQAEELLWLLKLRNNWIIPENLANNSVANILDKLWDKTFQKLEWILWEKLTFKNPTIFSTSWSLPLELKAIKNIKKQSKIIHIDTKLDTILKRLELMKTDRIIGMWKMNLKEILKYREWFYNISKDYNFIPNDKNHIETTNKKIITNQQNEIFIQFLDFFKNEVKAKIIL